MMTVERMLVRRPTAFPYLECIIGPPGAYHSARHLHEEWEIALNVGRAWQQIERGQTHHVPGDALLFTPPGTAHTASSSAAGTALYFGLRVAPAALGDSIADMTERPLSAPAYRELLVVDHAFHSRFLTFHMAIWGEPHALLAQEDAWQHLVVALHRLSTSRAPLPPTRREPAAVRFVKAYLHEQYQENVSLASLAQLTNMSTFALSRSFQAAVGMPPHAYQTQLRILHAKRLLQHGHSLGEVALLTGFHSQSHFGRHFKRFIGMTPGQYMHDCQLG